jgi:hypothetical protein
MTKEARRDEALFARLLCDVMIPAGLAEALRAQGYDVAEARLLPVEVQQDDEALLEEAASQGRAVVTCNYSDPQSNFCVIYRTALPEAAAKEAMATKNTKRHKKAEGPEKPNASGQRHRSPQPSLLFVPFRVFCGHWRFAPPARRAVLLRRSLRLPAIGPGTLAVWPCDSEKVSQAVDEAEVRPTE